MNCNRCQLAERIAEIVASPAAVDESELANLRRRCLSCNAEPSGRGGQVSFEAAGESLVMSQASRGYLASRRPHGRVAPGISEEAENVALDLLGKLKELDRQGLDVLHALLHGWGPLEMSKAWGLNSRQTACARVKCVLKKHAWLSTVYTAGRVARVRPSEAVPRECAGGAY